MECWLQSVKQKGFVFFFECSFQFLIANARAYKGVPFADLFFAFFYKGFKKKTTVLQKCIFSWICKGLLCLCFWKAFNQNSKPLNHNSPQFKGKGKRRRKIQVSQKGRFWLQMFIYIIANARACKGVRFVDVFFLHFFKTALKRKQLF